jgi:hypothetical protein
MTDKPIALAGEPIYQVWDAEKLAWLDVQPDYYAERLPSNRRILYAAPTPSAARFTFTDDKSSDWKDGYVAGAFDANAAPSPSASSVPSAEYTRGWQDCLGMHAAPPANPAPSVLTDEQITKLWYKHGVIGTAPLNFSRALLQANGATYD